jgi:hypothetical protein
VRMNKEPSMTDEPAALHELVTTRLIAASPDTVYRV